MRTEDEIKELRCFIESAIQAAEKFQRETLKLTMAPVAFDRRILGPLKSAQEAAEKLREWR